MTALLALTASAQTWDWTGPSGSIGSPTTGTWSETGHWDQGTAPASANDTILNFQSGTSNYDANNNTNITLNRINLTTGDGTNQVRIIGNALNFGGTTPGIFYDSTGNFFIRTAISAPGQTLILNSSQINDNFKLNEGGAAGNNSIDVGNLHITGGRVTLRGTQNNIGAITLGENAELRTDANNAINTTAVIHFGVGSEIQRAHGAVNFTSGGWQSTTQGAGNIRQSSNTSSGGNFIVNVVENASYTYSGTIGTGGSGERTSIIKQGLGTQILDGNMSAAGRVGNQVTVENGLLWLLESRTIATGNGNASHINSGEFRIDGIILSNAGHDDAINLNNGGTLSGSGEVRRTVNVAEGGTLSPGGILSGSSTATLTFGTEATNRTMTLNNGFSYLWEYHTDNSSDLINIFGALDLNNSNTDNTVINVVGLNGATFDPFAGNRILFATTGGVIGASNGQILDWTVNIDGGSTQNWFAVVDGNDVILAIPEPGTLLLLGITGIAGLIGFRRRR
ncbi:MAG: PEP-CTERM sorting domain-containing protein [Verrucomicrobia bacterium]|nr:PEP-CTERM sorting domain-containing protein [Verrucomicrobiota bacterium]